MFHWSNGGKGLMYNKFKKKRRTLLRFVLKRSRRMGLVSEGENGRVFFFKNYILADRNDPVGLQVNAWGVSLLMASVFTVKGETRSSVESKRKRDTGIWRGVEKHFLFFKCWKFSRLWWFFFINLLRLCGGPLVQCWDPRLLLWKIVCDTDHLTV